MRALAAISGLYDAVVGAFLLLRPDLLTTIFGIPAASPRIFSDLNAIFLIAVGAGYWLPWRDPARHRGYLWIMGVALKAAGALAFLLHYSYRGSPRSFLLFAASDGVLALVTMVVLLTSRRRR